VTLRVLATLKAADVIFAEDTRVTRKLLARYDIHTRVERCDEHVATRKLSQLLKRLEAGEHVAYVTDSGMPGISDPGMLLIHEVRLAGHRVDVLPGANAALTAFVASGLAARGFYFGGFLPRTKSSRKKSLEGPASLSETALIFYESPHRVSATLKELDKMLPQRTVCLARELTKAYEETLFGTPGELLAELEKRQHENATGEGGELTATKAKARSAAPGALKGEIVLVIAPAARTEEGEKTDVPSTEQIPEIRKRAADLWAKKELRRSQVAKQLATEFNLTRSAAYEAADPSLLGHQ